jgi:hypothetical protein
MIVPPAVGGTGAGTGVVADRAADSVTDRGADSAEVLLAASRAETVNEYGVLAESPVMDTDVPAGEATSAPSRYTR